MAQYPTPLTSTLKVGTLLLRSEHANHGASPGWLGRFHAGFNARFDRFRNYYGWLLAGILRRRVLTPLVACSVVAGAVARL